MTTVHYDRFGEGEVECCQLTFPKHHTEERRAHRNRQLRKDSTTELLGVTCRKCLKEVRSQIIEELKKDAVALRANIAESIPRLRECGVEGLQILALTDLTKQISGWIDSIAAPAVEGS